MIMLILPNAIFFLTKKQYWQVLTEIEVFERDSV